RHSLGGCPFLICPGGPVWQWFLSPKPLPGRVPPFGFACTTDPRARASRTAITAVSPPIKGRDHLGRDHLGPSEACHGIPRIKSPFVPGLVPVLAGAWTVDFEASRPTSVHRAIDSRSPATLVGPLANPHPSHQT